MASKSMEVSTQGCKHLQEHLIYWTDKKQASAKLSESNDGEPVVQMASIDIGQTASVGNAPMKKSIGSLTMIALCFNICNSWAGLNASFQLALLQGGPATLLYGMFITGSAYMAIALTIGELSSVYPTAGGQYHFVSILAPKRYNRGLSYTCGILGSLSWIAIGAAIMVIPSSQITALAAFYHPQFEVKLWHKFLIYEAFGVVVIVYNIFALQELPRTHDIGCK